MLRFRQQQSTKLLLPVVSLSFAPTLLSSNRTIIIPEQLKAYGGEFVPGKRELARTSLLPRQELRNIKKLSHNHGALQKTTLTLADNTETFDDMTGLPAAVQESLRELGVTVPSPIQQQAIPALLAASNAPAAAGTSSMILAGPHGSGKTFAYLAPLYARLMKDRDVYNIPLRENRPRAIIFAPTRELIWQIQNVCKTFDSKTGLKTLAFTSTKRNHRKWKKMMQNTMPDILILGPSMALRAIENHRLFLDDLRSVVLDEADELISETSSRLGQRFLTKVTRRLCYKHLWPVNTQTVFVTSALTPEMGAYVKSKHSANLPTVVGQDMHQPSITSQHRFVRVSRDTDKLDVLRRILMRGGWMPKDDGYGHGGSGVVIGDENSDSTTQDKKIWERLALDANSNNKMETLPSVVKFPNGDSVSEAKTKNTLTPEELEEQKLEQEDFDAFDFAVRSGKGPKGFDSDNYNNKIVLRWEHQETAPAPFLNPHTSKHSRCSDDIVPNARRCIVFFKNIDKCTALYWKLKGLGFNVALMHASLPGEVRDENYRKWSTGQAEILCATDLCSRGIDVDVSCVVNYDMPAHAKPYLNRAGRAARMGRHGAVVSLYTNKQKVIVSALKQLMQHRRPLEGINNYHAYMQNPSYTQFKILRRNRLAKKYISLISRKTIPAHLEKTYVRHNATWRPLFHPKTVALHGGVHPLQQDKITMTVKHHAIWHRRVLLASRKGGAAKFGGTGRGNYMQNPYYRGSGGLAMMDAGDDPQRIAGRSNIEGRYNGDYVGLPTEPPKI